MIIQRLFSSKAQKKLREKYEVLKGQDLIDKDNKGFHKNADEALKRAAKNKLPENHPKVKEAAELRAKKKAGKMLKKGTAIGGVSGGAALGAEIGRLRKHSLDKEILLQIKKQV